MKAGKTRESYLQPEPKEQPTGDPSYPRWVQHHSGTLRLVNNPHEHAAVLRDVPEQVEQGA